MAVACSGPEATGLPMSLQGQHQSRDSCQGQFNCHALRTECSDSSPSKPRPEHSIEPRGKQKGKSGTKIIFEEEANISVQVSVLRAPHCGTRTLAPSAPAQSWGPCSPGCVRSPAPPEPAVCAASQPQGQGLSLKVAN